MTPLLLFQYIVAIVFGIGAGLVLTLIAFALVIDTEKLSNEFKGRQ